MYICYVMVFVGWIVYRSRSWGRSGRIVVLFLLCCVDMRCVITWYGDMNGQVTHCNIANITSEDLHIHAASTFPVGREEPIVIGVVPFYGSVCPGWNGPIACSCQRSTVVIQSPMLFQISWQHQLHLKNHVTVCAGCPELWFHFMGSFCVSSQGHGQAHMLFYFFQTSKKPILSYICTEIRVQIFVYLY